MYSTNDLEDGYLGGGNRLRLTLRKHGKTNSQYGELWITNEVESKKINKDDLIPEGWD